MLARVARPLSWASRTLAMGSSVPSHRQAGPGLTLRYSLPKNGTHQNNLIGRHQPSIAIYLEFWQFFLSCGEITSSQQWSWFHLKIIFARTNHILYFGRSFALHGILCCGLEPVLSSRQLDTHARRPEENERRSTRPSSQNST
jgi:hypothetical protein